MTASEPLQAKPYAALVRWLMQKRWRMTRALTLGGQVCVIDAERRILLVRHGYRPGWHFPGGGVEVSENVRDAALRELDEEAGIEALELPRLHGIFNNTAVFPGDHVVVYVLERYRQARMPKIGLEIAELGFFPISDLPAGTTAATRRRIAEIMQGAMTRQEW